MLSLPAEQRLSAESRGLTSSGMVNAWNVVSPHPSAGTRNLHRKIRGYGLGYGMSEKANAVC